MPSPSNFDLNTPVHIISSTKKSLSIIGMGALTPGYILIAPKEHHLRLLDLDKEELEDLLRMKEVIGAHIEQKYGPVMFFEHGSARNCVASGACVEHAHLHVIPQTIFEFRQFIPTGVIETRFSSFQEFATEYKTKGSYLYLELSPEEIYTYNCGDQAPSQFFRQVWANALGIPDKYDWALFPESDNMKRTLLNFPISYK